MRSKMGEVVNIFKVLSNKTRLRIMRLLNKAKIEICVCEIVDAIEENQYNVSRHLKILKSAELIQENRIGKWVFYSLSNPRNRLQTLIHEMVLILPKEPYSKDDWRLKHRLSLRMCGECVVGVGSKIWHNLLEKVEKGKRKKYVPKTK